MSFGPRIQISELVWAVSPFAIARFGRENAQVVLGVPDADMDLLMRACKRPPGRRALEDEFTADEIIEMKDELEIARALGSTGGLGIKQWRTLKRERIVRWLTQISENRRRRLTPSSPAV